MSSSQPMPYLGCCVGEEEHDVDEWQDAVVERARAAATIGSTNASDSPDVWPERFLLAANAFNADRSACRSSCLGAGTNPASIYCHLRNLVLSLWQWIQDELFIPLLDDNNHVIPTTKAVLNVCISSIRQLAAVNVLLQPPSV